MANWFYRHPRALILVIGLIAVAGLSAYMVMPRMEDPLLKPRWANVFTFYPGADAERVETLVTKKIEDALKEIPEILLMRSTSRTGVSTIVIELRGEVQETSPTWSKIRDKIDDVVPELPVGCREPEFDELDVKAYAMLVSLTWNSDAEVSYGLLRRQAKQLQERLKNLSGTEKVDLFGDPKEQLHVKLDPTRLSLLGITPDEISRQLAASDSKDAAGTLTSSTESYLVEVDEQLDSASRVRGLPIHLGAEGRLITLGDIADVERKVADPPMTLAQIHGRPAIVLGIMARSDIRIDKWADDLSHAVREFETDTGTGILVEKVFDQNEYVAARMSSLIWNLILGALAVFVVVLLMMGLRNAIVVCSALPICCLMVLAGLRAMDVPLHQMSITGLIIALGLLIDNAIIAVDVVVMWLRRGKPAEEAIATSVSHLAMPLFGSTLTTVFAFAPIWMMPGATGEFVGGIAVGVILAVLSSLLVALLIVPALTAYGFKYRAHEIDAQSWWKNGIYHEGLARWYEGTIRATIAKPWLGVGLGVTLPLCGFLAAFQLKEQFFPPADRDQVNIELELPVGASLSETIVAANEIRDELLKRPIVADVQWFFGESAPIFYYNVIPRRKGNPNYGQALVQLRSATGGREFIREVQQDLDRKFANRRILVRQLEQGPPFDAPIEIRLAGPDLEKLQDLGDQVREMLYSIPAVTHTSSDLNEVQPKLALRVDEERTRLVGLTHQEMSGQLRAHLDGVLGGSILEETEELSVVVRSADDMRTNASELRGMDFIGNPNGGAEIRSSIRSVPLESISTMELASEIGAIPHYQGERVNEIRGYLEAGVLVAPVLDQFKKRLAKGEIEVPPGYRIEFGGEAAERDEAVGQLMANVGILGAMIVASLVLSFHSFRAGAIIGLIGFLSVGLGVGALWIFQFPFGFMAIIGTMGLIGVAINDSIVVLAGLREHPTAKHGEVEGMVEVIMEATRHVLSTTLTTIAGFLPLWLGGGGFWPPLAITIAGGVGGATILALYLVPAIHRIATQNSRLSVSAR